MNAQTEIAHLHIKKPTAPRFEFTTPTSGKTILKLSHVNGTTHSLLAASDGDKWTHPQTQCTVCSTQRPHKANVKATIGLTNKWRSLCAHHIFVLIILADEVHLRSSRAVGCSYVLFRRRCMLLCAISPDGHTEIPWCVSESLWGHYVLLQHSPEWLYRLYVRSCTLSSCYSSCRRLKKNLVKKCKTCCFFCFFILDEVWVALTPSWKFKQTCNTAHTRKKNSIHSFNSLFCDTFTSKHCGENF